ncbi:MAG: hypothetical protein M1816_006110 [Peltula sp. TS41687]|nr:MAG: hypothetical protein M1816_006110 [Peltula sp. TS41687]
MRLHLLPYSVFRLQSKHLGGGPPLRQLRCFHCGRAWGRSDLRSPTRASKLLPCRRGAKTSSKLKLNDLPQGVVPLEPLEITNDEPVYPTVVKQAKENMRAFEHCVLLTRVGSFYELYFEQAEEYGPLLNLKVARKKTSAGPVPMAGVPYFQLDRVLKVLVQDLNRHVAISEEFANLPSDTVKSGGLMFDRRVSRIITPGTLIDERFIDAYENNFLLAIHTNPQVTSPTSLSASVDGNVGPPTPNVGLAWLDLSTGDYFTQGVSMSTLASSVARIAPREIILDPTFKKGSLQAALKEFNHLITYLSPEEDVDPTTAPLMVSDDPVSQEDAPDFTAEELYARQILLRYAQSRLRGLDLRLQPPVRRQMPETMSIDKHSLRALEIKTTLRDGHFKGSLLHAVRRTVTSSGARLLNDWLTNPSTSLSIINSRLDLVEYLLSNPALKERLVQLLRRSADSKRLIQKFSLSRGDADDLIALARTIRVTLEIAEALANQQGSPPPQLETPQGLAALVVEQAVARPVNGLLSRLMLDGPAVLADHITEAIDEEGVTTMHRFEELEKAAAAAMAQSVEDNQSTAGETGLTSMTKAEPKSTSKGQEIDFHDVWVMKKRYIDSMYEFNIDGLTYRFSASPVLERLHDRLQDLGGEKANLESSLRERLNATTLTLRWTPGLGHICHLKGKSANLSSSMLDSARTVSSTKSTRSFYLPEWTSLGVTIDQTKLQIRAEEQRVFHGLRDESIMNLVALRKNAAVLDELDIACSSATLAQESQLIRPMVNASVAHKIIGGRHPMVEGSLNEQGRTFTTNDCLVGENGRIWFITGPNMAGKSTFLRQNALISIMAQAGLLVPAEYAELGIVDQIFSRVGSADNLTDNQSTFMVEMLEMANILKEATLRSFVIVDEIGRGTTPEDGIALASLFATHFHVLADMSAPHMKDLTCFCTDVAEESDGAFSYVHRLRQGVNRESHALKVAQLAGEILFGLALRSSTTY